MGIGGGAIGGVFVGIANYDAFPVGILLFLTIGAGIGAMTPPVGSLAGLGAVVTLFVASLSQSEKGFALFPIIGGSIGLLWSVVAWACRHKHQEQALPLNQEAAAAVRQDRIRLARVTLVTGLVLGLIAGVLIGGPFIIAGPFLGAIVGGAIFIGLMMSAFISGSHK